MRDYLTLALYSLEVQMYQVARVMRKLAAVMPSPAGAAAEPRHQVRTGSEDNTSLKTDDTHFTTTSSTGQTPPAKTHNTVRRQD